MLERAAPTPSKRRLSNSRLGAIEEYWLFDPKGEWLTQQLQGYRLQAGTYIEITDNLSTALKLRLEIDGKLIAFYRQDTGEKLLVPDELSAALRTEIERRLLAEEQAEQERKRAEQERKRAADLEAQLERYRSQLGELP